MADPELGSEGEEVDVRGKAIALCRGRPPTGRQAGGYDWGQSHQKLKSQCILHAGKSVFMNIECKIYHVIYNLVCKTTEAVRPSCNETLKVLEETQPSR